MFLYMSSAFSSVFTVISIDEPLKVTSLTLPSSTMSMNSLKEIFSVMLLLTALDSRAMMNISSIVAPTNRPARMPRRLSSSFFLLPLLLLFSLLLSI